MHDSVSAPYDGPDLYPRAIFLRPPINDRRSMNLAPTALQITFAPIPIAPPSDIS